MKKSGMSNLAAGLTGLGVMVVLAGALVGGSEPLYKMIAGRNRPISDTPIYNPGIYEGSARGYGGMVTVTINVSEYAIEDVKIEGPDETPEIGMAVANQLSKEIWLNQSHSIDSISGATMTSNAIKKALAECFRGAAKEGTKLANIIAEEVAQENAQGALPEVSELLKEAKDGTYVYHDEADDGNGFFNVIEVTIEKNRITALTWDAVNADGIGKRELSSGGNYNMTDNGLKWHEQADALAGYVLENQSAAGLMNEGGTTDAISSVSIHIGGFVDGLKKCLLLAKGDLSEAGIQDLLAMTPDGSYKYLGETADENGFRDYMELTVENHKITDIAWDCVSEDGAGKRQLSANGNYVMTDDGPLWYEQADALGSYVLEHQSVSGLENSEGYSDAVASVSIYIGGFTDSLKKCLMAANGDLSHVTVEGLIRSKEDGTYVYQSETADEKGFMDRMEVTVQDHKITSLNWDALNAEGIGKRQLSADGNYVMTDDGPLWYEQADILAEYVIEHQSDDNLMAETGYASDAVASVSIYIGGFIDSLKKCLAQ